MVGVDETGLLKSEESIMDYLAIRAKNELEREKSFTPQESLKFLSNKDNFRFIQDGIKRELRRLGKNEDLKSFRQLMREKGVLSFDGEQEKKWFEEILLPNKESAIKMCFAFGLSSKKERGNPEAVTATEFLWNVCRINGFNYRCAEDIIYCYALDKGGSFAEANELIRVFNAQVTGVQYDDSADETKGTYTLWRNFCDLSDWTQDELITELIENAEHFYRYNKTSKIEFQKLYKSLYKLMSDDIAKDQVHTGAAQIEGYTVKGNSKTVNISAEIIFSGFVRGLALKQQSKRGNHVEAAKTIFGSIIDKLPTEYFIDEMKSTAINKKNTTTDHGHGHARKVYILCFFSKYVLEWRKTWEKDGRKPISFYEYFYRTLDDKLLRCSYGALYPANPFDWLILSCIKKLDEFDIDEDIDILELFNEIIELLASEQDN